MKNYSENKEMLIATIINYFAFGFNILIAIFYTPFLLNALGDAEYGIRSFAISFVTYANILGTGIATAYLRFANLKKKEYGEEGVKDVDGVFFKIFLILGVFGIFVGLILFFSFFYRIIPLQGYSADQVFAVSVIVLLSFITLAVKLPCSVFLLILNFKRKFIFRNVRFLLSAIFEYLFSFLCILLGITVFKSSIIALSIVSLVSEIIFGVATFIYLYITLKHRINFRTKVVNKSIWKDIIKFSFVSLLIIAVMSLNDSTDRIILGFFSPESVTFYSLAIIFNAYIKSAVDSVSVLYTPRITEQATTNDADNLQLTFDFVSKICTIILTFIVFGYICCGREFLMLWLGPSREEIYYYAIPLMIGMIFLYPQHFSIQIHRAYGKQRFAAIVLTITFIINVGISIGLAILLNKYFNNPVLGCIIGTMFTYICETIILSIYNRRTLGLRQNVVWEEIILNTLICFALAIFVSKLFELLSLDIRPVFTLIIKGLTYIALFVISQFIFNKKDIIKLFKWRRK